MAPDPLFGSPNLGLWLLFRDFLPWRILLPRNFSPSLDPWLSSCPSRLSFLCFQHEVSGLTPALPHGFSLHLHCRKLSVLSEQHHESSTFHFPTSAFHTARRRGWHSELEWSQSSRAFARKSRMAPPAISWTELYLLFLLPVKVPSHGLPHFSTTDLSRALKRSC